MTSRPRDEPPLPPDTERIFAELREAARQTLDDTFAVNPHASLDDLNAALEARITAINRRPQPELGGISPDQVARLIHADWEQRDGAVRLNEMLRSEQLAGVQTLTNARVFLDLLTERGEVRVTPAGNLPRAIVADLVERMEWPAGFVDDLHRYNKVVNEQDVFPLHVLRVLLELAGLLKLRRGKLSPTRRGTELGAEARAGELFVLLFRAQFRTMNLAYLHPVRSEAPGFQQTVAFSLFRFGKLAEGWKTPEELADRIVLPVVRAAVPPESLWDPLHSVVEMRLLRPLVGFGLADEREMPRKDQSWPDHAYRKTRLFDRFLSFELSAGAPPPATPSPKKSRSAAGAQRKAKPGTKQNRARGAARGAPVESVYQLRITLLDTDPPIWRRIQVDAETTLGELHAIVQEAMGWTNSHLHKWEAGGAEYGPGYAGLGFRNEDRAPLRKVAPGKDSALFYEYDFGDSWEHELVVEEVLAPEPGVRYPRCVAAERAGPPEDVGGVWGYEETLEILADPAHPEHEERLEWLGGARDPEAVDVTEINRRLARLR